MGAMEWDFTVKTTLRLEDFWIELESDDRRPGPGEDCFVTVRRTHNALNGRGDLESSEVLMSQFDQKTGVFVGVFGRTLETYEFQGTVTHWMPFPRKPHKESA